MLASSKTVSKSPTSDESFSEKSSNQPTALETASHIILDHMTEIPTSDTLSLALSGTIWYDMNVNGIKDDDEDGVPGITVQARSCNSDRLTAFAFSDSDGEYRLNNVGPPGACFYLEFPTDGDKYNMITAPKGGRTENIILGVDGDNLSLDAGVVFMQPSNQPSAAHTTSQPMTSVPKTDKPTNPPSSSPSVAPTTKLPSYSPSVEPTTELPSYSPSVAPTMSENSTSFPTTFLPTFQPTAAKPVNISSSIRPTIRRPKTLSPLSMAPSINKSATSSSMSTNAAPTKSPSSSSKPTIDADSEISNADEVLNLTSNSPMQANPTAKPSRLGSTSSPSTEESDSAQDVTPTMRPSGEPTITAMNQSSSSSKPTIDNDSESSNADEAHNETSDHPMQANPTAKPSRLGRTSSPSKEAKDETPTMRPSGEPTITTSAPTKQSSSSSKPTLDTDSAGLIEISNHPTQANPTAAPSRLGRTSSPSAEESHSTKYKTPTMRPYRESNSLSQTESPSIGSNTGSGTSNADITSLSRSPTVKLAIQPQSRSPTAERNSSSAVPTLNSNKQTQPNQNASDQTSSIKQEELEASDTTTIIMTVAGVATLTMLIIVFATQKRQKRGGIAGHSTPLDDSSSPSSEVNDGPENFIISTVTGWSDYAHIESLTDVKDHPIQVKNELQSAAEINCRGTMTLEKEGNSVVPGSWLNALHVGGDSREARIELEASSVDDTSTENFSDSNQGGYPGNSDGAFPSASEYAGPVSKYLDYSHIGTLDELDIEKAASQETEESKSSLNRFISDLVWLEQKIADENIAQESNGVIATEEVQDENDIRQSDSYSYECESFSPRSHSDAGSFVTSVSNSQARSIVCRDCHIPPGLLDIDITSTKDGPMISGIGDDSLTGHLNVGDLIMALDDRDTRSLTAEQVSAALTSRSTFQRKLTLLHFGGVRK